MNSKDVKERVIGKKRTWNGMGWNSWVNILASAAKPIDSPKGIERLRINLNRGGPLNLYPGILRNKKAIAEEGEEEEETEEERLMREYDEKLERKRYKKMRSLYKRKKKRLLEQGQKEEAGAIVLPPKWGKEGGPGILPEEAGALVVPPKWRKEGGPGILPRNGRLETIQAVLENCRLYRQYTFSGAYLEPRVHVLLSRNARGNEGFVYHSVQMKSIPLECVKEIEILEREWSEGLGLKDGFSIGVDLICYRNGMDSISWHADDTQDETNVLAVVVESKAQRPVCIRPKGAYKVGDEELELYIGEGDGYELTGEVQKHYEHSLPKRKDVTEKRTCMIFRHGRRRKVESDSGVPCDPMEWQKCGLYCTKNNLNPVNKLECNRSGSQDILKGAKPRVGVNFGHPKPPSMISEGSLTSRRRMYDAFVHVSDQRGVSGNMNDGADAVVVARVEGNLRERDGLSWLRYTSTRKQGGGAMAMSYKGGNPIRVFRSSSAKATSFRPLIHEGRSSTGHQASVLRYDGLYKIVRMVDDDGNQTEELPPRGEEQWTFTLMRAPTIEDDNNGSGAWKGWKSEHCNELSLMDLWAEIQKLNEIPIELRSVDIPEVSEHVDIEFPHHRLACTQLNIDSILLNNPPAHNEYLENMLAVAKLQRDVLQFLVFDLLKEDFKEEEIEVRAGKKNKRRKIIISQCARATHDSVKLKLFFANVEIKRIEHQMRGRGI